MENTNTTLSFLGNCKQPKNLLHKGVLCVLLQHLFKAFYGCQHDERKKKGKSIRDLPRFRNYYTASSNKSTLALTLSAYVGVILRYSTSFIYKTFIVHGS
jgi:hypothetical protein